MNERKRKKDYKEEAGMMNLPPVNKRERENKRTTRTSTMAKRSH